MHDYYEESIAKLKEAGTKGGKGRFILLAFCLAFTITGVWYPAYFMWVVYAFAAYMAVIIMVLITLGIILLAVWFLVHWANKIEN